MKKNIPARLIIFDVDGTIVDAYRAIEDSLCYTLRLMGHSRCASLGVVRRAVGRGDRNFIREFLDEDMIDEGLRVYRKHHQTSLLRYSRPIAGSKKVLATLRRQGYKLAVASNRPRKFTLILLRHLGFIRYFDVVICAKDESDIKPHPTILLRAMNKLRVTRASTLYVGDMVIDVLAGKNAGVKTVAVTGGSSSLAELKKAKPFRIISNITSLPALAKKTLKR